LAEGAFHRLGKKGLRGSGFKGSRILDVRGKGIKGLRRSGVREKVFLLFIIIFKP
jgi:hypothetical protein